MILLAALAGTMLWLLVVGTVICLWGTPRFRTELRMTRMIREAEEERREANRQRQDAAKEAQEPGAKQHRTLREIPFWERVALPLLQAVESKLVLLAPRELHGMLEHMLFLAGKQETWSIQRLLACWVLSVALGGLLALLVIRSSSELLLPQEIAILLLGSGVGAAVPFLLLQSAIRQRKAALRRQLPEFLDLLCVSVQAGLSFDGAVTKIVGRMKGVLVEEFRRMLRDIGMGVTRQRALTQMARRCDIEEVYLFTTSIIQADRLGTSMGRTLKIQADNMRDRHRQYVRAEAVRAPVKIIFPMILFIFPSIFVMVLFPAVLALLKALDR